jgi:hypothetical protein
MVGCRTRGLLNVSLACSHVTSGRVVTLKDMVTTNPAPPPPPERGLCRNQQSAARVNRAATAHTRQRKGDTSRHSIAGRVPAGRAGRGQHAIANIVHRHISVAGCIACPYGDVCPNRLDQHSYAGTLPFRCTTRHSCSR